MGVNGEIHKMNTTVDEFPVINPKSWIFSETVYPDETGLPVPIFVHTCQEFITSIPVMGVSLTTKWNYDKSNWALLTISDTPIDISNRLSPDIFDKAKRYILLNKEKLIKYWCFEMDEPRRTAAQYLEKLK